MSWKNIINQKRAVDILKRGIAQQRIAHAYMFYGPDGVGKRATALALAQTLQCLNRQTAEPCETCDACRKSEKMVHPDVHVLFPHPNDATIEDIAERLRQCGKNPYEPFDYVRRPSLNDPQKVSNKQAIYSVARINEELRRAMSFKPVEGQYKVAILTDVEAMRVEAANAFLKLLEEPTPATVIILITSRPDRLLPTIVSRCQRLRFDVLHAEDILQGLRERLNLAEEPAQTIARMANGSFSRALELASNEELLGNRQLVIDYFRSAYLQHTDKISDLIEDMAALGRERLKGLLGLMLSWIRDLLLYRVTGNAELLINIDQIESISRFCENVPAADIESMAALVEQAIELIGRNVHVNLTLIVLAEGLNAAMNGRSEGRIYVPLDIEGLG